MGELGGLDLIFSVGEIVQYKVVDIDFISKCNLGMACVLHWLCRFSPEKMELELY